MLVAAQFREFHKAIISAYTPPELRRLIRFRLGKDVLDYTTLAQDQQQIVFDVSSAAERGGWTDQLILAARRRNQADLPPQPSAHFQEAATRCRASTHTVS